VVKSLTLSLSLEPSQRIKQDTFSINSWKVFSIATIKESPIEILSQRISFLVIIMILKLQTLVSLDQFKEETAQDISKPLLEPKLTWRQSSLRGKSIKEPQLTSSLQQQFYSSLSLNILHSTKLTRRMTHFTRC